VRTFNARFLDATVLYSPFLFAVRWVLRWLPLRLVPSFFYVAVVPLRLRLYTTRHWVRSAAVAWFTLYIRAVYRCCYRIFLFGWLRFTRFGWIAAYVWFKRLRLRCGALPCWLLLGLRVGLLPRLPVMYRLCTRLRVVFRCHAAWDVYVWFTPGAVYGGSFCWVTLRSRLPLVRYVCGWVLVGYMPLRVYRYY